MAIDLTHTRAQKISDGAVHTAQLREFFALMDWFPAPAPIHPEKLWRGNKFAEERDELRDALERDDLVAIADGLGDMAYVVIATMLTYGVTSSLTGFSWTDLDDAAGVEKALRRIPCVHPGADLPCGMDCAAAHLDKSERRLRTVGDNPYAARWHGLHALAGIDAVAVMTATPMAAVFTEIHRSNMTKTRGRFGEPIKGPGYRAPILGPLLTVLDH